MAEISRITLPSGNTYDIKDATARSMISGGVSYIIAWAGNATPDVSKIPAGVVVTYSSTDYTGTLSPEGIDAGAFYFVKNTGSSPNGYDEYVSVGTAGSKYWEKLGTRDVDLSGLGELAYKDTVTLSKGDGDNVLGEATTFTAAASAVSFSGGTTDKCLGSGATFTTSVTPTTTNIKATASGAAVGANGTASVVTGYESPSTDTFVKSYPGATSKLATTTVPNVTGNTDVSIPNVTSAGSASTWAFAMGTGTDAETLIISGANGSAPTLGTNLSASKVTLGTAKTVATGSLSASGSGGTVMTGLGTASTGSAVTGLGTASTETVLTGVKVTSQPTVALATGATAGTGVISVATGITSASTSVNNKDEVTAVTGIGTGTAAAQTITVGTNDKVKVAKYVDLSVSAS